MLWNRLLHIYVLASLASQHRHQTVPVIRRSHLDRIHIFQLEQLAEILELTGISAGPSLGFPSRLFVNIGKRDKLRVR